MDFINQPNAAFFMILTIVASTSCATPSSCGVLNIASRVVDCVFVKSGFTAIPALKKVTSPASLPPSPNFSDR